LEAATPGFMIEYDSRPNRLVFEYLAHPTEIISMLLNAYKLQLLVVSLIAGVSLFTFWRALGRRSGSPAPMGAGRRVVLGLVCLPLLFLGARSSVGHRPANPSSVVFSNDHLVNELCISSGYSVLYALYRLKDEADAGEVYGRMESNDQILEAVRESMLTVSPEQYTNPKIPTLHRHQASVQRERPLNLVIILEESLGARYVGALGGEPVTSYLDSLRTEGWWFDSMYATGTRSARGIEAVISGFLPTPARSVLKLGKAQSDFFTLASYLASKEFHTQFIYGGKSDFDNMSSFFSGNGFAEIIDEDDYVNPRFMGSWGVCDEDIFDKAHETFLANGDEPFFTLVFSVTNHSPFEFPADTIELYDQPQATVSNAVRYADYALRGFFEKARKAPYWDNTLFLVVADHDSRVFGADLVPIEHFHIPAVILGAHVRPKIDKRVLSQIDLAPTVLSLMGISGEHPMVGFDLTALDEEYPGRAMMQYGQNQAFMRGQDVVVLQPELEPQQFLYENKKMLPKQLDPSLVRSALAHALLPSWLYKERLYRLAPVK
jgi:phosphoglycerol transferase MdoB-like AlkP superfamily enzyme